MIWTAVAFTFLLSLQDPQDWIKRLASDRVEDRDLATRELKKLGDRARTALREAADAKDPETASRCRKILATLDLLKSLPPRLMEVFPGLEDRLALAPDESWTEVLLEATREDEAGNRIHPRLSRAEHLDCLAARALRGVPNPDTWQRVTVLVEKRRLKGAIPVLIEGIESDDEPVWRRSLGVLRSLDARGAVPAMVQVLRKSATIDRELVSGILAQLDRDAAIRELRKRFEEPEPAARMSYLTTASELGDLEAIPRLIQLSQIPDSKDWGYAWAGIEKFDPREGVEAFTAHLKHPDFRVRMHVLEALHRKQARRSIPTLLPLLQDPEGAVRSRTALILGQWKAKEAVPGLLLLLADPTNARSEAAGALGQIGDPAAIPELIAGIRSLPADQSGAFLGALADLGSKEAVPGLLRWLSSNSDFAKREAMEKLAALGAVEAIPAIAEHVHHKERAVRWQAVLALGQLQARDRLDLILAAFEEADSSADAYACRALVALKDPRVVPSLIGIVEGEKRHARKSAIEALAELKATEALPCLVAQLTSPGEDFQDAARKAIHGIGVAGAVPLLAKAGSKAVLTLSFDSLQPELFQPLLELLKDPDPEVRAQAAWRLESWQDRRAVPGLLPLLQDADENVRMAGIYALAALGETRVLPQVRLALSHTNASLRLGAVRSLVLLDPEDGVPPLVRALEDSTFWIRILAARGLARLKSPAAARALAALAKHPDLKLRQVAAESLDRLDESDRLSTARALLEDPHGEVRAAAAAWLCGKGHEEGIADLFDEGTSPLTLNAIRSPEAWARLERPWSRGRRRTTYAEALRWIGQDSGLLVVPPEDGRNPISLENLPLRIGEASSPLRFASRPESLTLRRVLEELIFDPFTSHFYEPILEKDRLRIVARDKADSFWKNWRAER